MRGISRLYADLHTHSALKTPGQLSTRTGPKRFSKPLYDTGEHVLTGENLAINPLIARYNLSVNGVPFSYSELIAAADLFADLTEMEGSNTKILTKIKALIRQSRDYYYNALNGLPATPDVSNADWEKVTSGRYLQLAEDNFEHFAFDPSYPVRNNKTMWETYHQRAMAKARSGSMEEALKTNAFGDHFLTDAFSAGHLVNKNKIFDLVNTAVYATPIRYSCVVNRPVVVTDIQSSRDFSNISQAGIDLVRAVCIEAYKSTALRDYMDEYEIIRDGINPDIDNESMFICLIMGIVDDLTIGKPRISNLVAKAIHDFLGRTGVEVLFPADGTVTTLYGDGRLDKTILQYINQAVEHSIWAVLAENATLPAPWDLSPVSGWDFTPRPTANGQAKINRICNISSSNTDLVNAMADVLKSQYKLIVEHLVKQGILGKTWW